MVKYYPAIAGWIALLFIFIVGFGYALRYKEMQAPVTPTNATPSQTLNAGLPMKTISIGEHTIEVEVASKNEQREQGLSGRASLEEGKGMLFIFDPAKPVSFWMKDMKFSLDIIFAKEDGTIVKMFTDVAPETYPSLFPSGIPIRYVLEVPGGYSAQHGLATGQKIVVQ